MPHEEGDWEEEPVCAGCGCPEAQFVVNDGTGFTAKTGDIYCCEDCAEGRFCECNPARSQSA